MSREIIVDLFAGGGGASKGIEMALGRSPDAAVNHDPLAVAMHQANHPECEHFCQDIWQVSPNYVTRGLPVGLLWASPDCTHFSKAKGSAPTRDAKRRDLAWVIEKWAREVRPRVIIMENVEEFLGWGPLDCKGRVIKSQEGETFRAFTRSLRRQGYKIAHRELRACDYGAPTIRKRFFLVARCDGRPIVWPEPTHGPGTDQPYRTAAECIDLSLPCPSIFDSSEEIFQKHGIRAKRPLAEATQRRIAEGVRRYVLEAAEPFIVTYYGAKSEDDFRGCSMADQFGTQTTENRHALISPYFIPRYGERPGQDPRTRSVEQPIPTIVPDGNGAQLVAAFMAQHNTGVIGHEMLEPVSTISTRGSHQQLVASHLLKLRGTCKDGQDLHVPMPTITSGGQHVAEVRAFLVKYFGTAVGQPAADPLHTTTAKARFGLVTVTIQGEPYVLADIGMRMLTPRELFRAQGFPDDYQIDIEVDGKPLTKTAQVRAVGNSVCPPIAAALARANYQEQPVKASRPRFRINPYVQQEVRP